ncbi:MAG: hypothetical protein KF886_03430 [Candidatus Hydrogenedentes bacterium]|nr:hypothetical protein [Candidatus Hydrogenedentota bacterium]
MIMADVFKILFLILGMLLCTTCHWLLFGALFPGAVARVQGMAVTRPVRALLTGALAGVPALLLGLGLAAQGAGPLKLAGVLILSGLVLLALFGATGIVRRVGQGLSEGGPARASGAVVLRGGAVVSTACVLPVAGWFVLLPAILIVGLGAALMAWWSRSAAAPAPVAS